jgi:hypothetical protein
MSAFSLNALLSFVVWRCNFEFGAQIDSKQSNREENERQTSRQFKSQFEPINLGRPLSEDEKISGIFAHL